jgi:hypothetical protein
VLFQDGSIAKSHARLPLGFLPAHPFAHELLGAFLYMQSHLFREVIVEFAAAEEIWNPVHGRLLLTGWGFARIEDKRDTFEHASEAGNLLLKMPKTRSRDLVGSDAAIGGRYTPLGLHQLCLEQSLERRIKRTLLHLQKVVRSLLDVVSVGAAKGFAINAASPFSTK